MATIAHSTRPSFVGRISSNTSQSADKSRLSTAHSVKPSPNGQNSSVVGRIPSNTSQSATNRRLSTTHSIKLAPIGQNSFVLDKISLIESRIKTIEEKTNQEARFTAIETAFDQIKSENTELQLTIQRLQADNVSIQFVTVQLCSENVDLNSKITELEKEVIGLRSDVELLKRTKKTKDLPYTDGITGSAFEHQEINTSKINTNTLRERVIKLKAPVRLQSNGKNARIKGATTTHINRREVPMMQNSNPNLEFHVSKFSTNTTTEMIREYLHNNGVHNSDAVKVFCLIPHNKDKSTLSFISFKVDIDEAGAKIITKPGFWPIKCCIKEFVHKSFVDISEHNRSAALDFRTMSHQQISE